MLSHLLVFDKSLNFTSDCQVPMPPTVPINHYLSLKPINRPSHILLFHANAFRTNLPGTLCFSQGKMLTHIASRLKESVYLQADDCRFRSYRARGPNNQNFNYELFNCNNFSICYWSWNYRGCWHQTCPPIAFGKGCKLSSLHFLEFQELIFLVTASPCRDWAIFVPAAFRRCGSRFSGSLSGIEP